MEKPVHTLSRSHTHTGIIIMDAHGLAERTRDGEREAERDGCLLSSGLPPLWLDRWMTSLCVCVLLRFFLPVSFFCPLFLTGGGGRKGRNGQRRSEATNSKYWLIREVERTKWKVEERNHLKTERKGRRAALIPAEGTSLFILLHPLLCCGLQLSICTSFFMCPPFICAAMSPTPTLAYNHRFHQSALVIIMLISLA